MYLLPLMCVGLHSIMCVGLQRWGWSLRHWVERSVAISISSVVVVATSAMF